MKKVFVVFLFIFSTVSTFAQSEGESVKPIGGITLYRNVSLAAIEQNNYLDVIVKFKAAELGDYFTNGVKVVVVDNKEPEFEMLIIIRVKRFIGSDFLSLIFMCFLMVQ